MQFYQNFIQNSINLRNAKFYEATIEISSKKLLQLDKLFIKIS